MINSKLDFKSYRTEFGKTGRVQILNFLDQDVARNLASSLRSLEWSLVVNEADQNFDISPDQAKVLGVQKMNQIKKDAKNRASNQFQYLFENYRVSDLAENGEILPAPIQSTFDQFNSAEFLKSILSATKETVEFADMQATRYRVGHFLTDHDDNVAGKNRKLAYVINLSERWRKTWGGQLEFLSSNKDVDENYNPIFNSLSLFKVPTDHRVSPVKIAAKHPRLSLTGWFRTHT